VPGGRASASHLDQPVDAIIIPPDLSLEDIAE
jgi:hypothetical protein